MPALSLCARAAASAGAAAWSHRSFALPRRSPSGGGPKRLRPRIAADLSHTCSSWSKWPWSRFPRSWVPSTAASSFSCGAPTPGPPQRGGRPAAKKWPAAMFFGICFPISMYFFLPFLLEDRPDSRLAAPGSVPPRPSCAASRGGGDQEVDPRQTVLFQEEEERWPGQGGRWWRARSDLAHRVKVVGLGSISTSSEESLPPQAAWPGQGAGRVAGLAR